MDKSLLDMLDSGEISRADLPKLDASEMFLALVLLVAAVLIPVLVFALVLQSPWFLLLALIFALVVGLWFS